MQAFLNTFSLFKLMVFFHFLSGGVKERAKSSNFVDFDWENASKWLEWCIFRVQGMPNPMLQVSSLCEKWFLKNHHFRQKFHILLILTGKNASKWFEWCIFRVWGMLNPVLQVSSLCEKWFLSGKNALKLLEWCIFRVQGMPNPMALVVSLYYKWFLKNHNFRRHIADYGVKNHKYGVGHMQQSSLGPILPYTMFQNPISRPFSKKWRKTILTQKVLVTQSSNIVHCDWHAKNLHVQICKPYQTLFPCSN